MVKTNEKMRVAIIGCGMIMTEHMEAWSGIPMVDMVAAVDIDSAKIATMKKRWGLAEAALYSDWKKMLAEVKPDAVDICLPNHLHCPAALDAFAAGCHVYVEKPMALSVAECQEMIDLAARRNRKLAVGFQQEYNPATEILVRAREAGVFGKIQFVKGRLLRRHGIPNYGVFYSRERGGGPIMDIGSHLIDLIHHVIGRPEAELVAARTWTSAGNQPCDVACAMPGWNHQDYDVEDLAAAQINFKNNIVLQLEIAYCSHIKEDCIYDFTLMGEKGGGYWCNNKPPEIYTNVAGTMMNLTPGWIANQGRPAMFKAKLQNFVDACLKDSPLLIPGQVGLQTQIIIDSIHAAAKAGKEIKAVNAKN